MVAAENLCQFLYRIVRQFLCDGRADDRGEVGLGGYTLHYAGVGRDDYIVLVHTPVVVALGLQYAHYLHGDGLEPNVLAYHVRSLTEQLVHDGLAHHAHLRRFLYVLLGEAVALFNHPLLDVKVLGSLTVNGCLGVAVAVDHLTACGHFR